MQGAQALPRVRTQPLCQFTGFLINDAIYIGEQLATHDCSEV